MVNDETTRAIYPTVEEIEDVISEAVSVILQSGQEPNDPAVIAALAAKAVQALQETAEEPQKGKGKGKGNLVPVFAKWDACRAYRVQDDDEDDEDEDEDTTTEPVPPFSEETEPATPPGGGDEGPKE